MSRVKQIFKFAVFGLAAFCLATTGAMLCTSKTEVHAAINEAEITNQLPVFFDNGGHSSEIYFNTQAQNATIRFDFIEQVDRDGDGQGDQVQTGDESNPTADACIYRYYPDGMDNGGQPVNPLHYYYLNIGSVNLYLNGQELVLSETSDVDVLLKKSNAPSIFDANFFPYTLDFQVKLNTASEESTITASEDEGPATLTLHEEGLFRVVVTYDLYDVTLTPASTSTGTAEAVETYSIITGQTFDYSIFMLETATYFNGSDLTSPNFGYNVNNTEQTQSESSNHRWNYFYNASQKGSSATNELPYITYNPRLYRLTITKSLNNSSATQTITFDPTENTFNVPSFVNSAVYLDQNTDDVMDDEIKIYFNDLGLYNIDIELIYTIGADVYELSHTVLDQKFYVYGAQIFYTDYELNDFAEFKSINPAENTAEISAAADITKALGTSLDEWAPETDATDALNNYLTSNDPVKTNQTPVRLSTYANNVSATLFTKTNEGWRDGGTISATTNLSDDGIYLIRLEYNFANYTNSSGILETTTYFYQYFYFEISKTTPEVTVETDGTTLYSGQYTNQDVTIAFSNKDNAFNSPVYVTLTRRDFNTGSVGAERYLFNNDETETTIEEDGAYTLRIYYGKNAMQETPITRTFTIDTTPIQNLQAYSVKTSNSSSNLTLENQLGSATNEAFVFTWQNQKDSGAATYGFVRYYPLNTYDYYNVTALGGLISSTLSYSSSFLGADRMLDLSVNPEWQTYDNAGAHPSTSIPANYLKESAGLYIFQVFDEAGNSNAAFVFLDDSSPYFAISTSNGYDVLTSSNHTLTADATIYWGDYKGIRISLAEDASLESLKTGAFVQNVNGEDDEDILDDGRNSLLEIMQSFISQGDVQQINLNASYGRSGCYYLSKIDDVFAFKDRTTDLYSTADTVNSMSIQFSFSVHYLASDSSFYASTTTDNLYTNILTGAMLDVTTITEQLQTADLYRIVYSDGSREFFYGVSGATTLTSLSDPSRTGRLSESGTLSIVVDGVTYDAEQQTFVDMEGEYGFMLRDESNTQGANLSALERLTTYPSNSQYITVTGDTSLTRVVYRDSHNDSNEANTTLFTAAYSTSGVDADGESTFKNSYYTPTALDTTLYISFVPTVNYDNGQSTQVQEVYIEFFPYQTQIVASQAVGSDQFMLSYYRTISQTPSTTIPIYSFDGTNSSTEAITEAINLSGNATREGKYVIYRTYMSGDNYTVDVFDYNERTLTMYVDRYGVITEQETMSYDPDVYTLVDSTTNAPAYTAIVYENLIVVSSTDPGYPLSGANLTFTAYDAGNLETPVEYISTWTNNDLRYILLEGGFRFGKLAISNGTNSFETNTTPDVIDSSTLESLRLGPTLESIVGGDIFVNMYDGIDDESAVLSVTFPHRENHINSGETFYTDPNDNWSFDNPPTVIFETNKLPVKVYIPSYKYTINNSESSVGNTNEVEYSSNNNPLLSYYDQNAISASSITSYQLTAQIRFVSSETGATRTYSSSGSENGFLTFVSSDGSSLNELTEAGTYYVLITQAANASGAGTDNVFTKNYMFAFTIQSASPEFSLASNGSSLSTLDATNYYTNQKSFTASWQDANDRYIADIDKTQIQLSFSRGYDDMIVDVSDGISVSYLDGSSDVNSERIASALQFSTTNNLNNLTLNLEQAGLYENGVRVSVTMQFVGHNDNYYSKALKTVVVDKTASNEMISSLIANVSNFSNGTYQLNGTSLRTYQNIDGTNVTTPAEAAYNISASTGTFQYYSYLVDGAFLASLASQAQENSNSAGNYSGSTVNAYYRAVSDPYSGSYAETDPSSFASSNFTPLSTDASTYTQRTYYEIVEQDLAGNLTIYLVYVYGTDDGNGFAVTDPDAESTTQYQGLQFTDDNEEKRISDAQILAQTQTEKVVAAYSSTNFNLQNLNLFGDEWLTLTISRNNSSSTYMFSPWEEGRVINMATGEYVQLSSLFSGYASSESQITLTLSNRTNGSYLQIALYLINGVSLNANHSSSSEAEYLTVGTSNTAYPVSVEITSGDNSQRYSLQNDPNSLENLQNSAYNYTTAWTSNNYIEFTYESVTRTLRFSYINLPNVGDKIRYRIVDNFGNVTTLVHIFGQSSFEEVSTTSGTQIYQDIISDPAITGGEYVTSYINPTNLVYTYNRNIYIPVVEKFSDGTWIAATQNQDYTTSGTDIISMTFARGTNQPQIDQRFRITVYEVDDENPGQIDENLFGKKLYLHLYEVKPELAVGEMTNALSTIRFSDHYGTNITEETLTDSSVRYLTLNGTRYRVTLSGQTFALNVTVSYEPDPTNFAYPYEVLYYQEGSMQDFEAFSSGTRFDESGVYYFLVRYAANESGERVLANEYDLYRVEILESSSEFYIVTNNGVVVDKAQNYYTYEGTEYSDYYITNVNYYTDQASVSIVPNDYQNIVVVDDIFTPISEGNGVVTRSFLVTNYTQDSVGGYVPPTGSGISPFYRIVFITYIPPTSEIVAEASYYYNTNETFNMLSSNTINAIISSTSNFDSVTIRWSKTYGISTNIIDLHVLKDGVEFPVTYRTDSNYNYVTLDRSGTYTLSFVDTAGNVQVFAYGTSSASTSQRFVFLKDVAFSMTFADAATGEQVTTDPINKGVFNGDVQLTILNMNEYYTAQSSGSGLGMIRAQRNGQDITSFNYDANTHTFTFSDPGYYTVWFVGTSVTGVEVRQQTYNFTIVNPNESRYSYEFAPYQNYYIKSVVKDNLGDITQTILNDMASESPTLGLQLQTVVVDGATYLKELVTSYIGTGSGRYTVTIATNGNFNRSDYSLPTELTFSYWINTASVPIDISLTEGQSSSSPITVTFNAERIYQTVGECMITVAGTVFHISEETISSMGTTQFSIQATGTYFITARSMSGNLLFSYKVTKTEPLNGWAIAAIVIGCVAVIVAVIIIVKLRKKIKVK